MRHDEPLPALHGAVTRRAMVAGLAAAVGTVSFASVSGVSEGAVASAAGPGEIVVNGSGTSAVQAAVNAVPEGGVVRVPAGSIQPLSSVTLPNKAMTLSLYGATIQTTSAGLFAFEQNNRQRLTVLGGRFTGIGNGIRFGLPPSDIQSYDFAASGADFRLSANCTGVALNGVREATITDCFFDACTGIHLAETVNTHVVGCQFRNCSTAIHADGSATGSPYNAGLMVTDATMLGCGYGVRAVAWDWASISNSMIDFCDQPVNFTNVDTASILGSYLSNRNFGSSAVPVVVVATDNHFRGGSSQHVRMMDCIVISHATDTPELSVGVGLTGVNWCSLVNNSIHFWQKYGLRVTGQCTYLGIVGNVFNPIAGGFNPAAVYGTNGNDDTWLIADNVCGAPIANTRAPIMRDNL